MSAHFSDRLEEVVSRTGSIACVGLDPRPGWEPREHSRESDARVAYSLALVDAVKGKAAAVKPQLAFLDDDFAAAAALATRASPELLVVADAKRGDIGSTAEAYAARWLGPAAPFDALTVNPYLGGDSLAPFVDAAARSGKGLFVLVKTSNPGGADLQDLELRSGERVYERVARLVDDLGRAHAGANGLSCVGAVVGATAPPALVARLRELMPRAWFLMPGLGAQGGEVASVAAALDRRGLGVLAPSSRSLAYPWRGPSGGDAPPDWRARVLAALDRLNVDLEAARRRARG